MNSASGDGVLYTEHLNLKAASPIGALWSFESITAGSNRPIVTINTDGNQEFWLDRSDPLLNTIVPGTGTSVIFNFGDPWSAGRSLNTATQLAQVFVVGPVLRPRLLRVGHAVRAIGAAFPSILTTAFLGVHPAQLLDRIVPLHSLWPLDDVERLTTSLATVSMPDALAMLRDRLIARADGGVDPRDFAHQATQLMRSTGGRVTITDLARTCGLSRQKFAREFAEATGMPPKLYARITRFQSLLHRLLTSDVSQWIDVSCEAGFYDQAHMINEFRELAGVSPTEFFRPHGDSAAGGSVTVPRTSKRVAEAVLSALE